MENNQKVNAMRANCFVILSFIFMYFNASLQAQEPRNTWVLDSIETGTKAYIARESISLLAGFKYSSSNSSTFLATIDPTLLFPPTDNSDDNITPDPALGGMVGAISGNFDVSQTGAAIYNVPIEVLPGIQGMQPNLSLIYNSQSGTGVAGMCWNLSGLSMISRAPKNYYHNNERSGIIWDNTSPLALDGQRLIRVDMGMYGNDSVEYRTESGLDRIVGYNIKPWGPLTFKVYTKDGKILEYGNTSMVNSYFPIRLNNTNIASASAVYHLGWALTRVIDANNNFVDYTYSSDMTYSSGYYNYNNVRATSISYGNHTGGTKETVGKVDFQYIQRTHPYSAYIDGMEMSNQYLLDKIEIKGVNDLLADTYEISYMSQDDNDFLTQIKKVNSSGEFILPLEFNWRSMSYQYAHSNYLVFGPTPAFATPQNTTRFEPTHYGDIDGDGNTDVLVQARANSGIYYWILYLNNGDNTYRCLYQSVWDHEYEQTFLFLDLDGTGEKLYVGRYRQEGSLWGYYLDCYKYQNNRLIEDVAGNIRIPASGNYDRDARRNFRVLAADFNGEGKPQFILFRQNHIVASQLGLGNIYFPFANGNPSSRILLTDTNGNGKIEIAYRRENTIGFFENEGNGFVSINYTDKIDKNDEVYTGDFNGDGNTDLLVRKNGSQKKWTSFISTGSSFIEKDISSYIPWQEGQDVIILDINKDGKSDVFIKTARPYYDIYYRTSLNLYISNGNDFITKTLATNSLLKAGNCHIVSNFRTGNDKDIFLSYNAGGGSTGPHLISLCYGIQFNKISDIKDSFGQQLSISYQDYKNPNPSLAFQDLIDFENEGRTIIHHHTPKLEVVNRVIAPNTNQSYEYTFPEVHRQARGFLGFSHIKTTDNIRSFVAESESRFNSTYHFLYPYRNTVKTTGGTLVNETVSAYTVSGAGMGRYFLKHDSLISTDALTGTTVKASYSNYDVERNPRTIKTDYGSGISNTETVTYSSAGSRFLNKIASRQVTQQAPGQANVVRREYFSYDGKGNPSYHVTDSTDVNKVQTFYGSYDKYGNPGKITTVANGATRSQMLTYTSSGRLVKTNRNDQLNETVTYDYEPLRLLLTSETDRIGTTRYEYDRSGRLRFTIYPDGVRTAHALQWAGTLPGKPANAKFYSYTETSGQSPVWVWYDAQGREIRRDAYGLNGKKVLVETEYNAKGELLRVSEPYFENTNKTYAATYAYDNFGRISNMYSPMGTARYTYSGLTTTVTAPSGTGKTTINPVGWVLEEEINGKKVNFTHYASGQIRTSTPQDGHTITLEYDLQGNRMRLTDPDAGVITTQYDGWGQLVRHEERVHLNSSPIVTTYNYHPSGLLNNRLRNGETTNYGYDSYNRLQSISISGRHEQSFVYDGYDRIIQSTNTVDGSKVFTNQVEYDRLGRVSKETYPGGYFITNHYDPNGYLTGILDSNNASIWNALESNAKGQLTLTSHGGRVTIHRFDARGFPVSIASSGIMDMRYSFTSKGNPDYRLDNLTGHRESFVYDPLNRLTEWKIHRNNVHQSTNTLSYNPVTGLISSKSDLGPSSVMNYGESGQPPHALTSITGSTGVIPSAEQGITYTDFKKTSRITEGDNVLDIMYGVGDQRIKSVLTNPEGTLTRYFSGNYEEEYRAGNTRRIHYINGGNGLAALYVQNNGRDTLYYVHTDYQGSILALSLADGTVKERYAYDPWGRRRNPTDWSRPDTRTSFLFHRGYTMHEHLPEFSLINMNGRVYDPLTAQFMGLDPHIQSPGNWLNYNRYMYAFNNPLIYTDPSGELAWFYWVGAAIVGGVTNLVSNWKNVEGFWDGFATFGVGAGAAVGIVATGGSGAAALVGTAGAGGALVGASNNVVAQTGKNFSGFNDVNWGQVGVTAAAGGVAGAASAGAGIAASNMTFLVNGVSSPVLRSAVVSPLAAGAGHVAGGTTASLFLGQNFYDAFNNSFEGIGQSMAIGGVMGISTTIGVSYANRVSPWTGKSLTPKYNDVRSSSQNLSTKGNNARVVTPDGVVLPEGATIPSHLVENPHRTSSYGTIDAKGIFHELLRIDPGTPAGMKGPNTSHFHLNGGKNHIFDVNKWPWWR